MLPKPSLSIELYSMYFELETVAKAAKKSASNFQHQMSPSRKVAKNTDVQTLTLS